ncbi:hypothetical protein H4217_001316 [Coemansia sp. RSA 1939]|nr:hypothetical protein H4217_001316 [Coemansia sp. RSA 1939]
MDLKFPVVSELLHASASGDYETPVPRDWQVVTKQRLIPLPDALFEQYDLLECRCFMGLFPEIKRAWITVDHRLFLWNYEDESDFYSFEDQEQIIVSVALVRPRPGVFVDTVKYVLAVATPLEVFLLGVGYDAGSSRAGGRLVGGGGSVTLYATQISVPADGVAMTSIAGSDDGRIFMSGNDGALYEFVYQAADGWLTKKARKVNLTSSFVSYFVPTFLATQHDTSALSMAVDNDRMLLYVLLQDASIKVFWLGSSGGGAGNGGFQLAHHHKSIGNSAALLCPQFNEGTESSPLEIVSMHVIPPTESRTLGLVAITGGGCRLYFSTVSRMQRFYEAGAAAGAAGASTARQPEVFEIAHVRLPPEPQPTLAAAGPLLQGSRLPRQMLSVHTAFYRNGTALLAHAWNEDHDSIVGAAPACAQILARIAKQPRANLSELSSAARIEGRTWAIAETDSAADGTLNDLATVSCAPARSFAVLTNAGVTVLEKQRPVDMFRMLVAQPAVQEAQIKEFVATFSLDETCAMCFAILCAPSDGALARRVAGGGMQALGAARRILFEHGGLPRFVEASPSSFGASASDGSGAMAAPSERIVLSGRHEGLAVYLARVLHPVWKQPAAVGKPERGSAEATRLDLGIPVHRLLEVQDRLRGLLHFISNNQRFVPDQLNQMPVQPANSSRSAADAAACWRAESESLGALYELMLHAAEAISFLCLLADFNLPAISERSLTDAQRKSFAGTTLSDLVCTDGGRDMCRDLILALISSQLKQHASIDSISDVLGQRCATLFSAADVSLYKALEALRLAGDSDEGAEAAALGTGALELLTGIAGTLAAAQVRELCASFEALGQYSAAASLALTCAAQSDPHDAALAFWGDGAPEGDPREAVYRKRMDCYRCVIELLDKRRLAASGPPFDAKSLAALPSTDALFQFALYDWLLENGQAAVLFQLHGPFVEQYLSLEPHTAAKSDMLWHYYIHENQFGKASLVQRALACAPEELDGVDLARRIEYLSLSIGNCKIAVDVARSRQQTQKQRTARPAAAAAGDLLSEADEINGLATVLRESEDQLEIAQVQLAMQQQLRSLGGHDAAAAAAAAALDRRLFTVTELYDGFAEPLKLWDAVLLLFKVSNHDDPAFVGDIWQTIARTAIDHDSGDSAADGDAGGLMAVASRVARLGRRLYPSPAAFPVALVARILADLARERPLEYAAGYVCSTLVQAAVPHWAAFEALNALYLKAVASRAQPSGGSSSDAGASAQATADLLAREVAALATAWIECAQNAGPLAEGFDPLAESSSAAAAASGTGRPCSAASGSSGGVARAALPLVAVDEALSQYIINATLANNVELKNELQRVQAHIRQAF